MSRRATTRPSHRPGRTSSSRTPSSRDRATSPAPYSAPRVRAAGTTPDCPAPVVTALDVFAGDVVIVSWSAPAPCPAAPASYDVEILSGSVILASQTGVIDLSASFAGLEPGAYGARVTPNFAPGAGLTVPAGSDTVNVSEQALGAGEVTVTRPPGALVLTQRCGVFGALPAVDAVDDFPGFPFDLPRSARHSRPDRHRPARRPRRRSGPRNHCGPRVRQLPPPGVPDISHRMWRVDGDGTIRHRGQPRRGVLRCTRPVERGERRRHPRRRCRLDDSRRHRGPLHQRRQR